MSEGKNLVGVDIGSSSIKVCQLKEGRKGYGLVRAGYAPLPPQSIVDGHVMNAQAVTEGLEKVFSEAKIRQKEVALSISGQAVIIRKISVPMMTAAELDERDPWVGAVAAFRGGLDRREVHSVAVAVAEEQRLLDVCPRLEPVGVVAEKLPRAADQGELTVQEYGVELGGQAFAVKPGVGLGDFR